MGWQSNHPWNKNRNPQSRRYNRKRRQNWNSDNYYNSAQNGPCNESWQQYPYQNNAYWYPVAQNMPIFDRSYAGYGISYNESHLLQHDNSSNSDNTSQYYQGAESNFQTMQNQYPEFQFGAPPRFNPACPSININYHQFSM